MDQASPRRSLSAEHTVVGFFGITGSGKSSLFNYVTSRELARTAVTRSTTSEPRAGLRQAKGSMDLLHWLDVGQRNHLNDPLDRATTGFLKRRSDAATGLILLDLPNFDSAKGENRATVERLVRRVDALVWVLDPQKYAGDVVHREFIRPLAAYAGVTLVVLNKADQLREGSRGPVADFPRGNLADDGLNQPRIHAVSARTGEGIEELRRATADFAVAHSASTVEPDVALEVPGAGVGWRLAEEFSQASGVDSVGAATRSSYRLHAKSRPEWPLTRWIGRLRDDPFRRLKLRSRDFDPTVNRTSLPAPGAGRQTQADSAVHGFATQVSTGVPHVWRGAVRRAARSNSATLPDALDQAIAGAGISTGKGSWWWPVVGIIQWAALVTALAGAGWLGVLAQMGYPQLDVPPAPTVEGLAVPTITLAGGILLGVVLSVFSAPSACTAAARRARAARRKLNAAIAAVAHRGVVEPALAEIRRFKDFSEALRRSRG